MRLRCLPASSAHTGLVWNWSGTGLALPPDAGIHIRGTKVTRRNQLGGFPVKGLLIKRSPALLANSLETDWKLDSLPVPATLRVYCSLLVTPSPFVLGGGGGGAFWAAGGRGTCDSCERMTLGGSSRNIVSAEICVSSEEAAGQRPERHVRGPEPVLASGPPHWFLDQPADRRGWRSRGSGLELRVLPSVSLLM